MNVVAFPSRAGELQAPRPVVTIARYTSPPTVNPWKPSRSASILANVSGWIVEAFNHPAGGVGVLGHYRDEGTAWQQASTIARANGWRAIRDRRLALAAARNAVREARQ